MRKRLNECKNNVTVVAVAHAVMFGCAVASAFQREWLQAALILGVVFAAIRSQATEHQKYDSDPEYFKPLCSLPNAWDVVLVVFLALLIFYTQ